MSVRIASFVKPTRRFAGFRLEPSDSSVFHEMDFGISSILGLPVAKAELERSYEMGLFRWVDFLDDFWLEIIPSKFLARRNFLSFSLAAKGSLRFVLSILLRNASVLSAVLADDTDADDRTVVGFC